MDRVLNPLPRRRSSAFAWFALPAMLAAGCATRSDIDIPGISPYRIEIQQGNFVTQEMIAKLKRGMSREQVRFVLGTPLVTDLFHANRWDYVFYRVRPGQPREERRIAVYFDNDRLVRVEGDVVTEGATSKGATPGGAASKGAASGGSTPKGEASKETPEDAVEKAAQQ